MATAKKNKQGTTRGLAKPMTQDTAEGLRTLQGRTDTAAANEEFTGTFRQIARRGSGWDPFEVWATRVKERRKKPRGSKSHDPKR
jgi:hypothetical protein